MHTCTHPISWHYPCSGSLVARESGPETLHKVASSGFTSHTNHAWHQAQGYWARYQACYLTRLRSTQCREWQRKWCEHRGTGEVFGSFQGRLTEGGGIPRSQRQDRKRCCLSPPSLPIAPPGPCACWLDRIAGVLSMSVCSLPMSQR
jgi:hypothetical protein